MHRKLLLGVLFVAQFSFGQKLVPPSSRWTSQTWDARWITTPESNSPVGVFHFRKTVTLWEKPAQFVIHISADNRYRLFVNGNYVTDGPQLSDQRHWRFESLDIAPLMQRGSNLLAVQVWALGDEAPVNQMGKRMALILQGEGEIPSAVNTDKTWKVSNDPGITPNPFRPGDPNLFYSYYAAGPMDRVDGKKLQWDWEKPTFDDSKWIAAREIQNGAPFETAAYGDAQWELSPRSIPLMERSYEPFKSVRRTTVSGAGTKVPITIEAKQKATFLFDHGKMTTAFPELIVSKGAGREIKITYAEVIMNDMKDKGHRDSVGKKEIHGVFDLFYPDGADKRIFTPLTYRAFRYVQVDISPGETPLVIEKFGSWFTAYPFEKKGYFTASDSALAKVFDVGFRTSRLCAYETYMDCPYWERLQYVGDTRIQALVSYYASGDDRLARNAIEQFEWSIQYDGLTYSRYPSELPQYIPNYSLCWVTMVYDFFLYRHDMKFVEARMPNVRKVLAHFQQYVTPDKLMTLQPYWDFLDHSYNGKKILETSDVKALTANALFYAYTLDMAMQMENFFKHPEQALQYEQLSKDLKIAAKERCWDAGRSLYADTPDKKKFSMHTNILAILCNMVDGKAQADMLRILMNDNSLTRTTLYFDFYLGRAMNRAGAPELYRQLLQQWKDLLKMGLTTFPEGVSRSDCHAWSASPVYEMTATLAGIEPDGPGFEKVLISPQLLEGEKIKAAIPHWAGMLEVDLARGGKNELKGRVVLPPGITGRLIFNTDRIVVLRAGGQAIDIKPLIDQVIKKKK